MMERGRFPFLSLSIRSSLDFVFNEEISRGVDTSRYFNDFSSPIDDKLHDIFVSSFSTRVVFAYQSNFERSVSLKLI